MDEALKKKKPQITVKSKIEAIGKQKEETQAFQKTLEALKETIRPKDENKWGYISVKIRLVLAFFSK